MIPRVLDCEPVPGEVPTTIFHDPDFVVVDKPAGWLTHPDGQGKRPAVTEWLDEPVGVHQRLDVDTTGVLVFSRSKKGARCLDQAFAKGQADKRYLAVTEKNPPARTGEISTPIDGRPARTAYETKSQNPYGTVIALRPFSGRTHQIRIHLAGMNTPIRGDARYGSALDRRAPRTLLHCLEIRVGAHAWRAEPPADFALALGLGPQGMRVALDADTETTAFRELNGEADGHTGVQVDRYGDYLWIQKEVGQSCSDLPPATGVYLIETQRDRSQGGQGAPQLWRGTAAPDNLEVSEHGIRYRVNLAQRLSTGLFLDQRPQRAYLAKYASGIRILNAFAHAGGFSVAAARAGAETVSIDLSKAWLDRIPPQLLLNDVDPHKHDLIYGDVFHWFLRLAKRGEQFDLVILDPPSTSVGKKKKRWSAARDYPELVRLAAPLLAPGGQLWTSTNHRGLSPERFAHLVVKGLPAEAKLERVCPPAVDFPCSGPAPVKTLCWSWPS